MVTAMLKTLSSKMSDGAVLKRRFAVLRRGLRKMFKKNVTSFDENPIA
jgi:hypothetical protein